MKLNNNQSLTERAKEFVENIGAGSDWCEDCEQPVCQSNKENAVREIEQIAIAYAEEQADRAVINKLEELKIITWVGNDDTGVAVYVNDLVIAELTAQIKLVKAISKAKLNNPNTRDIRRTA